MVANLIEKPAPTVPDHVEVLAALGQPTRLRIMRLLNANGELNGIELQKLLKSVDQPTISHHMSILGAARLVDVRREGLYKYYRVCPQTLEALTAFLTTL